MIDPAKKPQENWIHLFDPVGLITDSYASHVVRPARRATRSHDGGSPLRFVVEAKSTVDGGESDSSSPRLWSTPAPKPPPSPDSRTQAIARGRRELMVMIKDIPESSYELSLRDIVDRQSLAVEDHKNPKLANYAQDPKEKPRKKMNKKMSRSRSVDNGGFLLKTSVFPMSFWLKTKKKKKKLGAKPPLHSLVKRKSESESGGVSSSNAASATTSRTSSASSEFRKGRSHRFLPDCFSFKAKKQA